MQDIIAIGIATGGYFCGAVPLAVYAGQWANFNNQSMSGSAPVASSASATSVSFRAIVFVNVMAFGLVS